MTEEDYLAWREHPMTRWFMSALRQTADANENLAKDRAWAAALAGQADKLDPQEMTVLAIRAGAYRDIATADFETIAAFYEDDDEHERD